MNKKIISVVISLILLFSMTTPISAATKPSTKTVTFNSYNSKYVNAPVTVKITNVTEQKTKDFSLYLSDDKVTIKGKKSKVIYCKASTTITLQTPKSEDYAGFYSFSMYFDSNKVAIKSIKTNFKYYAYDVDIGEFDFSHKYDTIPGNAWGYADGSTQKLTKAGTYVLYVKSVNDVDDTTVDLTPIFIVVK